MRNSSEILLAGLVALSLLLLGLKEPDSARLASRAMSALREGDWDEVSRLFHIPGNLSISEEEAERTDVARLVRILSRQFGKIQSTTHVAQTPEVHELGVMAGDATHWNAMFREGIHAQHDYRVNFSLLGEGYVRLVLFQSPDEFRLRNIQFALTTDVPKNKATMEDIALTILLEMEDFDDDATRGSASDQPVLRD